MGNFFIGGVKGVDLKTYNSEDELKKEVMQEDCHQDDSRNYYVYITENNNTKLQKVNKKYVEKIINDSPSVIENSGTIKVCTYADLDFKKMINVINYNYNDVYTFEYGYEYFVFDLNNNWKHTYYYGDILNLTENIKIVKKAYITTTKAPTTTQAPTTTTTTEKPIKPTYKP